MGHFSFFILVVHEGSHLMFFVTKNIKLKKYLNRMFSYPIAALSFQDHIEDWELGHLEHHRNPIKGDVKPDPQNCLVGTRQEKRKRVFVAF